MSEKTIMGKLREIYVSVSGGLNSFLIVTGYATLQIRNKIIPPPE
jgi:hypothetical protein